MSPDTRCGDLHLHTFFSDGTYSPEELVGQAQHQELDVLALTDHDTTDRTELLVLLTPRVSHDDAEVISEHLGLGSSHPSSSSPVLMANPGFDDKSGYNTPLSS